MRYTLFACDEGGGHQMRSDSDMHRLCRDADKLTAQSADKGEDIRYVVKNGYDVVYKGKVSRKSFRGK